MNAEGQNLAAHLLDGPPVVDAATLDRIPPIVSVDDHVVEPPHVWERWLPARWASHPDRPRVERRGVATLDFTGGTSYALAFTDDPAAPQADCWVYEDLVVPHKRHVAAVGFARDDMTLSPITYDEMRPGCFDPHARLDDMTLNGVEASLNFPTFPRFCGQTFAEARDKDLALACVRAYNDWTLQEWCATDRARLVPLVIVPLWDVELAVAELRRVAALGVTAVAFSEVPYHLGLPSLHSGYWDPFVAACAELSVVICMHIGSSSKMPATSPDAPPAVQATLSFNNAMACLSDWLFSGLLERHPTLTLALSEGQIGWIPYILERADDVWVEHRAWGGVAGRLTMPPSAYFRRQVYGCFFRDRTGIALLDRIGTDRVTVETDYPHTDSTFPHTRQITAAALADVAQDVVDAICAGNARRMLRL